MTRARMWPLAAVLVLAAAAMLVHPMSVGAANDGNGIIFSYLRGPVHQTVVVTDLAGTTEFHASARARNEWWAGHFMFRVEFLDASDNVLTTITPFNASLAIGDWGVHTAQLTSADPKWTSIAKVRLTVDGDDGGHWGGNHGTWVDEIVLYQVKPGGTTQLVSNPDFAQGTTGWTGNFQTCPRDPGSLPCVTIGGFPVDTTTTTTTSTTTTTTTPTTSTTEPPSTSTSATTATTATSAPTTDAPTTTVPATSPPTTDPTTTSLPRELAAGEVYVLVDGSPRVATVVPTADGLNITSGAFTWHLASALGSVRLNTVDGALVLRTDGTLQVWGAGAGGASPLDVWLHSDPTHLGRLTADVNGGFNGTFPIPDGAPAGVHTVRVAGVAQDGSAVQLEVGVVLTAGGGSLPHTGTSTSSTTSQTALAFLLLGAALVLMTRRRVET